MEGKKPELIRPSHLLWALLKLKTYCTEEVCCSIITCDSKTCPKWMWTYVKLLSELQVAWFYL